MSFNSAIKYFSTTFKEKYLKNSSWEDWSLGYLIRCTVSEFNFKIELSYNDYENCSFPLTSFFIDKNKVNIEEEDFLKNIIKEKLNSQIERLQTLLEEL
jgi:hypothetical protein